MSVGSRAICYAKRALEILDRLGCAQPVVAKGIGWNVGKVFFRDELVYRFDLLPEPGHRRPAFVNLQQYWLEEYLVARATSLAEVDVRWESKVVGVRPQTDGVSVRVATPDGEYALECDWLIAADGSRSAVRQMLGARMGRPGLSRPLPHRRHPHEVGFSDRALVLVRPAVPPEPVGATAPPGRRRVAHRFPAGLGRRPRRGEEAGAHPAAPARHARGGRRIRDRMGERLYVPVPPHAALSPWPRAVRRRCRARGVAVRGEGREQRHPGRRQSRLEARARAGRAGARTPARHLRFRARAGRRREHPQFDALDGFHHAKKPRVAHVPRCGARSCEEARVRAPARQQRAAFGTGDPRGLAAQHARPRSGFRCAPAR